MPQKKNPDALELLRGKSGRTLGQLTGLLTTLKGLPSTYNKDLQEDKEPLFDAMNTMHGCVQIAGGVLATLEIDAERMGAALVPEMLATDLADYLVRDRAALFVGDIPENIGLSLPPPPQVRRGVPFRETHHVAGAAVKLAEEKKAPLSSLTLAELRSLHPAFDEDVSDVWRMEASVEARDVVGGTSREAVLAQVAQMRAWLAEA